MGPQTATTPSTMRVVVLALTLALVGEYGDFCQLGIRVCCKVAKQLKSYNNFAIFYFIYKC